MFYKRKRCYQCEVAIGQRHHAGCAIEQCPYCGWLLNCCPCEQVPPEEDRLPWTGLFPGAAECREFGWYFSPGPFGHGVRCGPDEPGAMEHLNRLHQEARWSRPKKRFLLRPPPAPPEPRAGSDAGREGRPPSPRRSPAWDRDVLTLWRKESGRQRGAPLVTSPGRVTDAGILK